MNLTNKPPLGLKSEPSDKDPEHLDYVHRLPCMCCGRIGVEAHHCRDKPDHEEREIYTRIPGAGRKSHDRDAIPLCMEHHKMFHLFRSDFHEQFGRDYRLIPKVRELVERLKEDDILGDCL